ncbi:hypothetical protein [Tellurirhabdus bombi]|uniref:hypothetical protein n=1 Tax=Tellurirhabdus bombi TaxID=2907205 RepID=UPI001F42D357|nr:hypothetical protein [Tellurirhabdus bombi]
MVVLSVPKTNRKTRWSQCVTRIYQAGLVYPKTAAAISHLETGGWNGRHTIVKYNNWFAFKQNSRNYSSGLGSGGYCIYATADASIADYKAYEKQVIERYRLNSEERYQDYICQTYSADRHYRKKLNKAIKTTQELLVP